MNGTSPSYLPVPAQWVPQNDACTSPNGHTYPNRIPFVHRKELSYPLHILRKFGTLRTSRACTTVHALGLSAAHTLNLTHCNHPKLPKSNYYQTLDLHTPIYSRLGWKHASCLFWFVFIYFPCTELRWQASAAALACALPNLEDLGLHTPNRLWNRGTLCLHSSQQYWTNPATYHGVLHHHVHRVVHQAVSLEFLHELASNSLCRGLKMNIWLVK